MESGSTLADGRYILLERLGSGGMAAVHRAEDTRLGVERARSLATELHQEALGVLGRLPHNGARLGDIAGFIFHRDF